MTTHILIYLLMVDSWGIHYHLIFEKQDNHHASDGLSLLLFHRFGSFRANYLQYIERLAKAYGDLPFEFSEPTSRTLSYEFAWLLTFGAWVSGHSLWLLVDQIRWNWTLFSPDTNLIVRHQAAHFVPPLNLKPGAKFIP